MDEFHGGGEVDVVGAVIAAEAGGREGQHRAQALATGPDKVGCHFGNSGGVFAGHPFRDECVHSLKFRGQKGAERLMRFCGSLIQTHHFPVTGLDIGSDLPLHPQI
ncbi:hypothetical protein NBRC116590_19830 [Pelagimonas sp. KU-00592-HH]